MQLIEVTTSALARDFILVNVAINKNNPNYIRPLDMDVHEVFNAAKNKSFRFGEAIRWILKDENGKLLRDASNSLIKVNYENQQK